MLVSVGGAPWSWSASFRQARVLPLERGSVRRRRGGATVVAMAEMVSEPVVLIVRTTVFYALMHAGVTGRDPYDEANGWGAVLHRYFFGSAGSKNKQSASKFRTKWHPNARGTSLVRRYRVPTLAQGRKLLASIVDLLSSDDTFTDAGSHKGCRIRRENAHAESVCCYNVRALLDEMPTPHLVVEITVFPQGQITETEYSKAEKIEKVLRTGASI